MWEQVAQEMKVPWRAAEAMHWQLGESDMAERAGVVPRSHGHRSRADAPTPSSPLNASAGNSTQVLTPRPLASLTVC